jgi:hypothetical protein
MSAIICLPVDFRTNSVGLPALLEEEIDGAPVLYHTVNRLTLCDDYKVVLLFAEGPGAAEAVERARGILAGLDVLYHTSAAADVPNREFMRRARLWALSSWRGGIGWTSYYDEVGAPAALLEAGERFGADAVGLITPDSPYADPRLAAELVAWHYDRIRKARVTVTGVPPGLAPAFFNIEILKAFAQYGLTFAASMAYKASAPQRDLAATEAHYEADIELRVAPWRLTAHSARQIEMMRALAAIGISPRSAKSLDVVRALAANTGISAGPVPAKIEIEPTSRVDAAPFYLREFSAGRRAVDMPVEAFTRIVDSVRPYDDVVMSLEGLGEPLLHPEIARFVAGAKAAGMLGVHLGTYGRLLDAKTSGALSDAGLDILSIAAGAQTADGYRALFGTEGLEAVQAAGEALLPARKAAGRTRPLIVAEITKTRPGEPEIEPFYDYWTTRCDWPVIRPYNDFAGQIEDIATIHMRTSSRMPCRKVMTELYIDAEGIAYPCRQDIRRTRPLGDAAAMGVPAVWRCEFMEKLRAAQAAGDYDFFPLCRQCKDWYYA